MYMIIFIYFMTFLFLMRGWNAPEESLNSRRYIVFNIILCSIIVLFVGLRTGEGLIDYNNYIGWFNDTNRRKLEVTFKYITEFLQFGDLGYIYLFLVYSILSVGIRYYGIVKYSPLVWFSFASWFCFILILHDMIQIRAAVSSALLLCIIPNIYNKNYIKSAVLILLAFLFHRSSIIYLVLYLLNTKKDYWYIWVSLYIIFTLFSILNFDIFSYLGFNSVSLIEGEERSLSAENERPNMFAPLTLIQTFTCFFLLYHIKRVKQHYKMTSIWLKVGFLSLIIYGTGIFVISVRLAELFSTVFIILFPLMFYAFKGKYGAFHGKLIVSLVILAYLTNYIFFRRLIPF